jgi:IS30 family transposase
MSDRQREIWKFMLSEGNVSINKIGKTFNTSRQNISKLINRGLKRAAKLSAKKSKNKDIVRRT